MICLNCFKGVSCSSSWVLCVKIKHFCKIFFRCLSTCCSVIWIRLKL